MTSPSGPVRVGRAAEANGSGLAGATSGRLRRVLGAEPGAVRAEPGEPAAARPYDPGPRWARYLPPAVALALSLWNITVPSFWRDEAATVAAISRPFGDLIRMLGNVDAVHSIYYITMWPLARLFGAGEFVLRFPSALITAVTAAAVAAIGRRLISPRAGLAAGLVFALLPVASRYGQEARPYAFVVAMATITSYLLTRVLGASPARRRRWMFGYGISLAFLGIVNIFGLLLIGGHAITVALHYRHHAGEPEARRTVVSWLCAAAAAVAVASPLLAFGWLQRGQIAWLAVNHATSSGDTVLLLPGSIEVTAAIGLAIGVAIVVSAESSRQRRRASWPRQVIELGVPWLVVPPVALLAASVVMPVYTSRYILMCVPALALLAGAAVTSLGRVAGPVALAVIAVAGLPAQLAYRTSYGHYDDIRYLDQVVAAQARPGDVVLYTNPNAGSFGAAYPYGLGTLPNVAMRRAAIPSGTLWGTSASLSQIRARLRQASRVWVVEINQCVTDPQLLGLNGLPLGPAISGLPLQFSGLWHVPFSGDYLVLYSHGTGSQYFTCPRH